MDPILLLYPAAAAAVLVLAALLFIACRGAELAKARQDRRYRVLELRSEERSIRIRTDRHLWEVQLREARQAQRDRHLARQQQLHSWHREFRTHETARPGVPGVRWPG